MVWYTTRVRRIATTLLVAIVGCGSVGGDGAQPPEPEPTPAPEPEVVPEPEPEPEPEPPPTIATPEPEPEPEPGPPEKLWPDKWEPRILAIQPIVAAAAAEHGVDPYLINGVIWVESKFDRKARNRSGARGLMQLMPKTAKSLGRALKRSAKVYDAEFNVQAGTYYLSRLIKKFDGDETLALASYVRGPSRVRAWVENGESFPDGVQGFIDKVERARSVFAALQWPPPAESTMAEPAEP